MSGPTDELMRRILSAAAARLSDEDVARIIADATSEAEAEVKGLIRSAMKAALLRRAADQLSPFHTDESSTRGADEAARQIGGQTPPAGAPATQERGDPSTARDLATRTARYVYCILPADRPPLPGDVPAVGGHASFDVVRHQSLAAITTPVGEDEFGQAAVEARLNDRQWLEGEVLAHERVLRAAMAGGAIVPLRFCTVLRSRDDVVRVLATHHDRLIEVLETLDGTKEWGVKIYRLANGRHAPPAHAGEAPSGREYLARRNDAWRARSQVEQATYEAARECHRLVAELAGGATELPIDERHHDTRRGRLLVNGAYLVPDEDEPRFHATVAALAERLAAAGLSCEVTGPWPAYNFVNLDLSLPVTR